jgi:hypothetical protein
LVFISDVFEVSGDVALVLLLLHATKKMVDKTILKIKVFIIL